MIVESDIDWEVPYTIGFAKPEVSVTEPAEAPANVDYSDTEEHYSGVAAALSKAQEVFDFVDVPQKRCHCHCKMGPADTRFIDGFSNQEQDSIRCFYFEHRHICRDTFLYLADINKEKLTNLKRHYEQNGLVPRRKKSGGRTKTALTLEDVKDDLRVLPSHLTRKAIWQLYDTAVCPLVIRKMKLRAFCQLWKQLLPYVVVANPKSDLCWVCQQNNTMVMRSLQPFSDKRTTCDWSPLPGPNTTNNLAAAAKQTTITHDLVLGPHQPNSSDISFHYSFDFAQQIIRATDQVHHLVITEKRNGSLRRCLDPRPLNVMNERPTPVDLSSQRGIK
ncbi:hypothetical protein LSAT2_009180 [Lamellibrachia satsuma]|nr:hypothetical protein LSAT2_009180 [Lamellibrachia satsuma]